MTRDDLITFTADAMRTVRHGAGFADYLYDMFAEAAIDALIEAGELTL